MPMTTTDRTVDKGSGIDVVAELRPAGGADARRVATTINQLVIHLDLTHHDIRNEAQERLNATRNVYQSVRPRFPERAGDSDVDTKSAGQRLGQPIRDLPGAHHTAEAAVVGQRSEQRRVTLDHHRARSDFASG